MKTNPIYNATKVVTFLLCLLPALHSWSASFTLNPSADAFVTTGGPSFNLVSNNYGGAGALSIAAPGSPKGDLFNSQNFGQAAGRPILTIVAVPEPAVLALGTLGLAISACRRLGHRRSWNKSISCSSY